MTYSKEFKEEIKKELLVEKVSDLSKKYNISTTTLYKWKKEIEKEVSKVTEINIDPNNKAKLLNIQKYQIEMKKLTRKGDYYEALKLANSYPLQSKEIDIQKASILYKIGTLTSLIEARLLYRKYIDEDESLIPFYIQIKKLIKIRKNGKRVNFHSKPEQIKEEITQITPESKMILKTLLTKLYCNVLTLEEINSSDISDYEKVLLTIAYYEKTSKKAGLQYIKEKKKEYIEEPQKLKTINFLTERLKNNKTAIFNVSIYGNYLGTTVDSEEAIEILKNKNQVNETVETNNTTSSKQTISSNEKSKSFEPKKEKIPDMIISREGKRVTSRHQNTTSTITTNNSIEKQTLIKEVFKDEILEIGKYLYIKMQNMDTRGIATIAWDNLEVLINKPITNRQALEKMSNIIKKIEELSLLDIQYNENNVKKHLNKSK